VIVGSISVSGQVDFLLAAADERQLRRAVRDCAEYVRGVWESAVSGTFIPGMRKPVNDDEYRRSLGLPTTIARIAEFAYAVTADYHAVERIELGYASFDMKPGLLRGKSARTGKDGAKYATVPFRFGTPNLSGPNKGESRPHFPGEQTMPADVYERVKDGTPYPRTGEGARTKVPLTVSEYGLGGVNAEALMRDVAEPMSTPYTWKSGLYDAMTRRGAPGHRQYYTFRRVSEPRTTGGTTIRPDGRIVTKPLRTKGSDPNSWIHPGQAPNPVVDAVTQYCRPTVEPYLARALAGLVSAKASSPWWAP